MNPLKWKRPRQPVRNSDGNKDKLSILFKSWGRKGIQSLPGTIALCALLIIILVVFFAKMNLTCYGIALPAGIEIVVADGCQGEERQRVKDRQKDVVSDSLLVSQ